MTDKSDQLMKRLLQHSALQSLSEERLQQLTEQYPYFSTAHLLLLKKLEKGSETHTRQKAIAALHVYNPLYLDDLLKEPDTDIDLWAEEKEAESIAPAEIEPAATTPEEQTAAIADAPLLEKPSTTGPEESKAPDGPEAALNKAPLAAGHNQEITFEPYHTVDYFASQGIKLSQAEVPTDRFGKQLKSFTEWLKTMKKVPTTALTHNTDGVGEKKVENLAAHSLQKAEIITESMAEVWIKQGNKEKASEVYNKLSLQNPSKKAYFAAKIESLKKPS